VIFKGWVEKNKMSYLKCDNCKDNMPNVNSKAKYCIKCKRLMRKYRISYKFVEDHFKDLHPIYREQLVRLIVKKDILT